MNHFKNFTVKFYILHYVLNAIIFTPIISGIYYRAKCSLRPCRQLRKLLFDRQLGGIHETMLGIQSKRIKIEEIRQKEEFEALRKLVEEYIKGIYQNSIHILKKHEQKPEIRKSEMKRGA